MIILFLILALILLGSGGVGLFYVNTGDHIASGSPIFFLGNLTFATFLAVGVLILIFMAIYNMQAD